MARILDPRKVEIRCSNCKLMAPWCEECKKYLCKKCNISVAYDIKNGARVEKKDADCGCHDKKK